MDFVPIHYFQGTGLYFKEISLFSVEAQYLLKPSSGVDDRYSVLESIGHFEFLKKLGAWPWVQYKVISALPRK